MVGTVKDLKNELSGLILGGAVFNTQMNDDPLALPVAEIISKAFGQGINAIDTSPYYGPSEELIGKALQDPRIKDHYKREDYIIMTKAGRIALEEFDYSKEWIASSVRRSLQRFNTNYLDLVYCHDIEFVTEQELLEGVGALYELQKEGIIHRVGISAYHPATLAEALPKIKKAYGKVPEVLQNYAHFTLQNTTLEKYLDSWLEQGVETVINSSPLNMGLLSGRPAAPFHPAPTGLRNAAMDAVKYCDEHNERLADVSLRYTIGKYNAIRDRNGGGFIINGISFVEELDSIVAVYSDLLKKPHPDAKPVGNRYILDAEKLQSYEPTFEAVRNAFGEYIDVEWTSPPAGYVNKHKK